ncbi:hypothetical protein ACLQ2S_18605 [Micromonospora sp. DT48]|uniref:hypothetical protein n=1 Tax=unclassified Micromonospora TaxID=2617518 RepID=UPI0018AD1D14|nr:hypothetical protein [Micromonospora sp. CP22]
MVPEIWRSIRPPLLTKLSKKVCTASDIRHLLLAVPGHGLPPGGVRADGEVLPELLRHGNLSDFDPPSYRFGGVGAGTSGAAQIGIGFLRAAAYGGLMRPAVLLTRVAAVTAAAPVVLRAQARRVPARAGQPRPAGRSPPETVHQHVTARAKRTASALFLFPGRNRHE